MLSKLKAMSRWNPTSIPEDKEKIEANIDAVISLIGHKNIHHLFPPINKDVFQKHDKIRRKDYEYLIFTYVEDFIERRKGGADPIPNIKGRYCRSHYHQKQFYFDLFPNEWREKFGIINHYNKHVILMIFGDGTYCIIFENGFGFYVTHTYREFLYLSILIEKLFKDIFICTEIGDSDSEPNLQSFFTHFKLREERFYAKGPLRYGFCFGELEVYRMLQVCEKEESQ